MAGMLIPGHPAPWFHARALDGDPRYAFSTVAGRWTVMLLMGSGAHEATQGALRTLARHRDLFDDRRACFFGVTVDPDDVAAGRIAQAVPGIRWFLDYDRKISAAYGAVEEGDGAAAYSPHWLLLDPMLRVHAAMALDQGEAIVALLRQALQTERPEEGVAPVLIVPNVFSPQVCRQLIERYEAHGGEESGFMREVDGVTTRLHDHAHKRRSDHIIEDPQLARALNVRIGQTLGPMIKRAFQFEATRIERFLVACYDAADGGHFRAHRDNTTAGTAHRRFACTINLNAEDYEGGDLAFPEFGSRTYRAPTGGAVVFSCSLLHEARLVTRGKRYAFLPFFYDDEGARIRERNLARVSPELQAYRAGLPAAE